MPVYGNLKAMSLTDLLQWASETRKTGVLEVERHKDVRRIEFRNGWITGCSSDDPRARLGQFLLARGVLTTEQLEAALEQQEQSGRNLGLILLDLKVLSWRVLKKLVSEKAMETIHGLFEWDDAVFRFHEGATLDPNQIEVDLSAREVLMAGAKREDELKEIRADFASSGIVLRLTGGNPPEELLGDGSNQRAYDAVDGERTLAEIILHSHGSEFEVFRFLHKLQRAGLAVIKEVRSASSFAPTIVDVSAEDAAPGPLWDEIDFIGSSEATTNRDIDEVDAEVDVAKGLMARGEYDTALALLSAAYRAHPDKGNLRRLILKAESASVEKVRRELSPSKIPVLRQPAESVPRESLGPEESYMLTMLNGESDIRSLLWLTPMRELDALKALRSLVERGIVELHEPQTSETAPG